MKKILLTSLISTITIGLAHADGPTLYGRINVSIDRVKNDLNTKNSINVDSNASRFGLKGSEKLTDLLSAVYQIEWGVVIDNNTNNISANPASGSTGGKASNGGSTTVDLNARNRFLGLQYAGIGTLKVGRFDSYVKTARLVGGGDVDIFNAAVNGNIANTQTMAGHNRLNNVIGFESVKFDTNGFGALQYNFLIQPNEKTVAKGSAGKTGANGFSGSILYTLDQIGLSSALAFDRSIASTWAATGTSVHGLNLPAQLYTPAKAANPATATPAVAATFNAANTNLFRWVGVLDLSKAGIDGVTLNAMAQQAKLSDNTGLSTTPTETGYLVSAVYRFPAAVCDGLSAKIQYQTATTSDLGVGLSDIKIDQVGADLDYAFSAKTKVFGYYAKRQLKNPNNPVFAANAQDQNFAYSVLGVGMEQKF